MTLKLRHTTENDLPYVIQAECDPANRPFVIVWPERRHRAALTDQHIEHLIVESDDGGKRLGFVILAGLKHPNRNVEFLRIVITEKAKGYGRDAIEAVKHYAFKDLNAHRLWLDVKQTNVRARALYEKEGFQLEGVLRECLNTSEGFESLVVMSLLEHEYRQ